MNKVFQINLGGTPFTIDEDAYEHLNDYLGALHRHFRGTEGYKEITGDIEARMAELFTESMDRRTIVTMADVNEAIQRMGRPEDFGAEPFEEGESSGKTEEKKEYRTGKKLYRDSDESMVGGVAAGIAAYFGIHDPIWIRALFVIMVLSGGFGVPLYILLWIIVPEAKTSGDRLAMRGKPINVDNITRIVREEFDHLSEKVSELSEEWTNKKKAPKTKAKSSATVAKEIPIEEDNNENDLEADAPEETYFANTNANYAHSTEEWYDRPRRRPTWEKILRVVLIIIAVGLMLWLAIAWFAIIVGAFVSYPYLGWVFPGQEHLTLLGMFNTLFVIGIPITGVVMLLSKFLFRSRIAAGWRWGLAAFWFINLCSLGIVGSRLASQFVADADNQQELDASSFAADTVRLSAYDLPQEDMMFIFDGQLSMNEYVLRNGHIHVNLTKSNDQDWHLVRHSYSRGNSQSDARRKAAQIIAPLKYKEGSLSIPSAYEITKEEGFKGQHLRFELKIPEGAVVQFDPSFFRLSDYIELSDNDIRPRRNKKALWRMESDGLSCVGCAASDEASSDDQKLGFESFEQLYIKGQMKIMIDRDQEFGVRMTGPASGLEAVSIEQTGDKLVINGPSEEMEGKPLRLYLTLPQVASLELIDTDDVRLRGFEQEAMELVAFGDFEVKSYGDFNNLSVSLSKACELELRGKIEQLDAKVTGGAKLDGDHAEIITASIEKSEDAKVGLPESTNL